MEGRYFVKFHRASPSKMAGLELINDVERKDSGSGVIVWAKRAFS